MRDQHDEAHDLHRLHARWIATGDEAVAEVLRARGLVAYTQPRNDGDGGPPA